MALQLSVITSCVLKWSINPLINPKNPVYSHYIPRDNIIMRRLGNNVTNRNQSSKPFHIRVGLYGVERNSHRLSIASKRCTAIYPETRHLQTG
jgi:hypothetical protein